MHSQTLIVALALTLAGCWSVTQEPDGGAPGGQQVTDSGASGSTDGGGFVRSDARTLPPAEGERTWLIVSDVTEGICVGDLCGADIDAIEWFCPHSEQRGNAVEATGIRQNDAVDHPTDPALGPPDGPPNSTCEPITDCSAPLGPRGWLALRTEAANLAGCDVTVHEVADRAAERFEVYACKTGALDDDCTGPHFSGEDGQATTGTIGDR